MEQHRNNKGRKQAGARILLVITILLVTVAQASALIDLITPKDGNHTNKTDVTFDYYPDLDNGADECALEANGNVVMVSTNVTNSEPNSFQTANIPEGEYDWRVSCSNSNTSEESEIHTLTVDRTSPQVKLISPADNSTEDDDANLTFAYTDNESENATCTVDLDGSIIDNVTADNNTQTSVMADGLSEGSHEWSTACTDLAGNTQKSETRTFTSEINADFSISLNKQTFEIDETAKLTIDAPDGTNLTLEICPDGDGFVECYSAITLEEKTYPREETLPFTNKTGDYIIDAFFNYEGEKDTKQLTYTVINNMQIDIDGEKEVKTGEEATLAADATGGTGALSYTWKLHNGTTKTGKQVNLRMNSPGEYEEKLTVEDEAGNKATKKVTVKVFKAYEVTVTAKDDGSGDALKGVAVELGEEEEETGKKGKTTLKVRKGTRELTGFLSGYELYEEDIQVDKDKSITIRMKPKQNKTVTLELTKPEEGATENPGTIQFGFRAKRAKDAKCTLLIREEDGGYNKRGTRDVNDSEEKLKKVSLQEGSYQWKVRCTQNNTESESEARDLTVDKEEKERQAREAAAAGLKRDKLIKDLNQVLNHYAGMDNREREIAKKLGYHEGVKDAIKKVRRASRDIHDLPYRTDMSDEQKEAKKKSIIENTTRAYEKTVKDVNVKDTKNFVSYPTEEDIKPLVEAYADMEGYEGDTEAVGRAVYSLQGKLVVSTKAVQLNLERIDGTKEEVTAVIKEVKVKEPPKGTYILEHIPKGFAEKASEVKVLGGDYEVIKEDPVLKLELEDEIAYYVEGEVDLSKAKGTNTIIAHDGMTASLESVTGSATFGVPDVDMGSKGFLALMFFLLLIVYLLHGSDLLDDVTDMFNKKDREKQMHYIRVLVNDALDNLEAGDYDKASLIYREIKLSFDNMDAKAKQEVYEEVINLVNKMDIAYSRQLSENIDEALKKEDYGTAKELYKRLQATYRKLGDDYKKEIYGKIKEITGRMQQR